jgi:hypothetical protein
VAHGAVVGVDRVAAREAVMTNPVQQILFDLKAKYGFTIARHMACAGYQWETPGGLVYGCAYDTTITCDECKYGNSGGRKNPTSGCNQEKIPLKYAHD